MPPAPTPFTADTAAAAFTGVGAHAEDERPLAGLHVDSCAPERAPAYLAALRARVARLDAAGPALRSVVELDPDADGHAAAVAAGAVRGPLAGLPVLLKDNIDTAGSLASTAGSLALLGIPAPVADAPVAARLRAAGAVIAGKLNLSEWANFRSERSSSGWSGRGGQTRNPHALDRSPGGSSAGSGAAVAAGLVPVALGTETDGSILCPAALNGVVGIKPTVGLTSRTGVIPISPSQDTVGPLARTVADAAAVLAVIAERPLTVRLDPDALRGVRLGVPRQVYCGYSTGADAAFERALSVLSAAGATIVDPADIPTAVALRDEPHEMTVLVCEFAAALPAYLATRPGAPATLAELIAFNRAHADTELALFGQEILERAAASGGLADPAYGPALAAGQRLARAEGIDAALRAADLAALVMPTYPPAWKIDHVNGDGAIGGACSTPMAVAGYPAVTVPCGLAADLPVGLTFAGTAGSDATLIALAYAYEQASREIVAPSFAAPRVG